MLPGSEIETDETREKFGLKTKYMIRKGSCGLYPAKHGAVKSIEFDEMLVATDAMTEHEWIFCTHLQWLIFLCWNHGLLMPLLRYLRDEHGLNPVDVILMIMNGDRSRFPRIDKLFSDFRQEIAASMFETPEAGWAHYESEENWNELLQYIRVELKYNAIILGVQEAHNDFFDYIKTLLPQFEDDEVFNEIFDILKADFVDVQRLVKGELLSESEFEISGHALGYIDRESNPEPGKRYRLKLSKSEVEQVAIKEILEKEEFSTLPVKALERLLGVDIHALRSAPK